MIKYKDNNKKNTKMRLSGIILRTTDHIIPPIEKSIHHSH